MNFNLASFIKDNLVSGFKAGTFDEYQVNIFSANYLMKGQISQADFDEIQEVLCAEVNRPETEPSDTD